MFQSTRSTGPSRTGERHLRDGFQAQSLAAPRQAAAEATKGPGKPVGSQEEIHKLELEIAPEGKLLELKLARYGNNAPAHLLQYEDLTAKDFMLGEFCEKWGMEVVSRDELVGRVKPADAYVASAQVRR